MSGAAQPWGPDDLAKAGECEITVTYDGPDDRYGKLYVDRADPIVWAQAAVLEAAATPDHHPDVGLADNLLTIRATNRTVIYRIGEYDQQRRRYLLTWPD